MTVDEVGRLIGLCARHDDNGVIAAECRRLAGGVPDADGIAVIESVEHVHRAAYLRVGLRTIEAATTFDGLIDAVAGASFDAASFRIDVHDPRRRADRSTSEMARGLAGVIPFGPDLRHPEHRFMVVVDSGGHRFCEVVAESDHGYRVHDAKPWTTSSSVESRLARALVNLVPDARSVIDPCCGAGSIVVEAASLGLVAMGADRQPAMVGMTRENLAHFGYEATVERSDAREIDAAADAVVTDLPYGRSIDGDDVLLRSIVDHAIELAPQAVFVAHGDISSWLDAAGYDDIDICDVAKRPGFSRWVHVAARR